MNECDEAMTTDFSYGGHSTGKFPTAQRKEEEFICMRFEFPIITTAKKLVCVAFCVTSVVVHATSMSNSDIEIATGGENVLVIYVKIWRHTGRMESDGKEFQAESSSCEVDITMCA